jgi:hypothetical protein
MTHREHQGSEKTLTRNQLKTVQELVLIAPDPIRLDDEPADLDNISPRPQTVRRSDEALAVLFVMLNVSACRNRVTAVTNIIGEGRSLIFTLRQF